MDLDLGAVRDKLITEVAGTHTKCTGSGPGAHPAEISLSVIHDSVRRNARNVRRAARDANNVAISG